MGILTWLKLGGVLLVVSALGFLVWDYNNLRTFKEEAKVELAIKAGKIQSLELERDIQGTLQNLKTDLQGTVQNEMSEARQDLQNAQSQFDAERLRNASTRHNEWMSNLAKEATAEKFRKIEQLSHLGQQSEGAQ